MRENNYEIIDKNGVIHSGTLEEMERAFAAMIGNVDWFETKKEFKAAQKEKATDWEGDLKLIQVLDVVK